MYKKLKVYPTERAKRLNHWFTINEKCPFNLLYISFFLNNKPDLPCIRGK